MVEKAVILSENGVLKTKHFHIDDNSTKDTPMPEEIFDLELVEKNLIIKVLNKTDFNRSKAAKLLGISWHSLDRRMKKYNID